MKLHRFQVATSAQHYLYSVCSPPQVKSSIPTYSSWTLFYRPHPTPPVETTVI